MLSSYIFLWPSFHSNKKYFRWCTLPPEWRCCCFTEIKIQWKFDLAGIRPNITSTILTRFKSLWRPDLAWFKRWLEAKKSIFFIKIIQDSFIQLKRFFHYRQLSSGLWHGTIQALKMEFLHAGTKWKISLKKGFKKIVFDHLHELYIDI